MCQLKEEHPQSRPVKDHHRNESNSRHATWGSEPAAGIKQSNAGAGAARNVLAMQSRVLNSFAHEL